MAMLSHELRNPLAPVRNAAQVIRLIGEDDPNIQRAAEMIERQMGQMNRLVDDLLDVSRITEGKITLRKELVELSAILAHAVETSRPLIDGGGHQLAVTLSPEPVWLQGDVTRLAQVFSNILNNSAKYTKRGGKISVAVERTGGEAVVRIRDNGTGISPEVLPHVFDLFAQGDRSLARLEGGLGIGLSVVKNLVEMHGGRVQAFSGGQGQGSEIVVILPVVFASGLPAGPDPGLPPPPSLPLSRVLVVDDNRDAADSLATLLRMSGYPVLEVYSGEAALKAAPGFQPDIVLLDIGLPEMDGYEVIRRLRQYPELQATRFVAVTGYGQESDVQRSLESGFALHLVKPLDPAKFLEVLTTLAG